MNIEELRQYCLSLPESVEKLPFERFFRGRHSILAFYTAGHIFCFIRLESDLDDTQIRSLIRQSYDVVRGGGRKNTGKNRRGV